MVAQGHNNLIKVITINTFTNNISETKNMFDMYIS